MTVTTGRLENIVYNNEMENNKDVSPVQNQKSRELRDIQDLPPKKIHF